MRKLSKLALRRLMNGEISEPEAFKIISELQLSQCKKAKQEEVPPIGIKTLHKIHYADGGICFYCNERVVLYESGIEQSYKYIATKDHILPRALGGPNHISNYVLSCQKCNQLKGGNSLIPKKGNEEQC